MIAHVLEHYPVVIGEDELLVGRYSSEPLTPEEERELEQGREYVHRSIPRLKYGPGSGGTGRHRVVDYERVLGRGIQALLEEIGTRDAALDYSQEDDAEKHSFYTASRIALRALLRFAERYREALEERRDREDDPARKSELARLVDVFDRVPARPPRDFYEALQCVWFVQFSLTVADDASCTGRPDNYLWPCYRRDVEAGSLTREFALRLIEELFLRSNEVYDVWPETIMLGGLDRAGQPVLNDLTYLFIEAIERVGMVNPNIGLCYRAEMPDELLLECVDKIGKGLSHPAIYNDRVITDGLSEAGLAPEDARYYINSTCVEITPIGTSNVQVGGARLYPVKALELTLNAGEQMRSDEERLLRSVGEEAIENWKRPLDAGGTAVDLATLDTFERFLDAYRDILAITIRDCVRPAIRMAYRIKQYGSCPLVSCFIKDCLERGKDAAAGGARYNYWGTIVAGFVTAVDSLSAIREVVYEQGRVSLPELRDVLLSDFEGAEDLRQYLLNRCPSYGNDIESVDAIATVLYDFMRRELARYRTCLGGTFHLGIFSGWGGWPRAAHETFGLGTAATPDGRRAGQPLSECIGPKAGADRLGPTAMANSVTQMDHRYGLGGLSVNCRFTGSIFETEAGRRKVADFIREFMRKGGFEIQFTVVDSETLRDAQERPEDYRTLLVRVAGYSDYFCNLDEALQDEIIARTEHAPA